MEDLSLVNGLELPTMLQCQLNLPFKGLKLFDQQYR